MKIYLLSIDGRRCFFYADETESPDDQQECDEPGRADRLGWRAWAYHRWSRVQAAWDHSDARAVRWTRNIWLWMHSWAHPDEAMLSRLRSARRIELHHPAGRTGVQVLGLWHAYLDHRWWRHVLWAAANGIVAPPALLMLWILPGPNIIGYWFAYRAVHHALIVRGISRVRRGQVALELRKVAALDWPIERDDQGKARHEALDGPSPRLEEHVAWTESEPSVIVDPAGSPPAAPPSQAAGTRDEES
ncbi:MAG: hypothetical protein ACYC61_24305 [Isosphaeraceae bacterium]